MIVEDYALMVGPSHMSTASNPGSECALECEAKPAGDSTLLDARQGLERLAGHGCGFRVDESLTNDIALRILSGGAAAHRHPWDVWKAYFRVAATNMRSSIASRRGREGRTFAQVLGPATVRREGSIRSPDRILDARETAAQVVGVFRILSAQHQEALLRRDWLGQSIAAIARQRTGRDDPKAKNAAVQANSRAQDAFVKALKREFGDEFHLVSAADPETMHAAFQSLAVRYGLCSSADDSDASF